MPPSSYSDAAIPCVFVVPFRWHSSFSRGYPSLFGHSTARYQSWRNPRSCPRLCACQNLMSRQAHTYVRGPAHTTYLLLGGQALQNVGGSVLSAQAMQHDDAQGQACDPDASDDWSQLSKEEYHDLMASMEKALSELLAEEESTA